MSKHLKGNHYFRPIFSLSEESIHGTIKSTFFMFVISLSMIPYGGRPEEVVVAC